MREQISKAPLRRHPKPCRQTYQPNSPPYGDIRILVRGEDDGTAAGSALGPGGSSDTHDLGVRGAQAQRIMSSRAIASGKIGYH